MLTWLLPFRSWLSVFQAPAVSLNLSGCFTTLRICTWYFFYTGYTFSVLHSSLLPSQLPPGLNSPPTLSHHSLSFDPALFLVWHQSQARTIFLMYLFICALCFSHSVYSPLAISWTQAASFDKRLQLLLRSFSCTSHKHTGHCIASSEWYVAPQLTTKYVKLINFTFHHGGLPAFPSQEKTSQLPRPESWASPFFPPCSQSSCFNYGNSSSWNSFLNPSSFLHIHCNNSLLFSWLNYVLYYSRFSRTVLSNRNILF